MNYKEVKGDLLKYDTDKYTFVHCIATDLRWGLGIAPLIIKNTFNAESYVRPKTDSNPKGIDHYIEVGTAELTVTENAKKFYNLFTKEHTSGKPSYLNFTRSLKSLKEDCIKRGIKNLAMPKIGCGLDRLEWEVVREIIKGVFLDTEIDITVVYI